MIMKKYFVFLAVFFTQTLLLAQSHKLLFSTPYGSFKVVLYDFTPNHQKMFLKALSQDVYKEAFFNRVIKNFVVQGGMHDEEIAQLEKEIPKNERKRLPFEFNQRAYHKLGAMGAGRDNNPNKGSFFNQVYFVVGDKVTSEDLVAAEQKNGFRYNNLQRETYLTKGGLPRLDGDYTVFGEVYEGLDVLIKISQLPTNKKDVPVNSIPFEVKEINEKSNEYNMF